ncbi:hypothetical protein RhiirC2_788179 [Rhizophagus irregularis]|uniref:Uncharacterized protein n=1 Tax=Rhizophagus irregularis TaxID=588596 RepID=A0A2N1MQN2_9GLOM|nr:hypothetical protein RhiirC2_788179 [Rhizophagus irregularis]
MNCYRSKTSQKKLQARFKALKAARKSQFCQLEDGIFIPPGYLVLNGLLL